ncbi:MAG: undecaprenyldiphospho-muramoylpentapeptide beta-N-acetylglucosaminyltransferase [Candidatus Tectomicrobia bacterium]|uniref:UDP-N-acetylglucosamine--N-acetylmuramyl-(pentapeptide) pyrophosphoryl-undecaprenol N-acetylglucosamine transferase n=1 Tax=Tectimicrobiota bacterium TaxID=2528274 RepID=A0A932MN84_UNCTE|nr:undecaprenyldiphospho-muramoylpentapeptide beta-N-acetylglucosaminyltransferase [Candidatus Tectomicrobia bacterium]
MRLLIAGGGTGGHLYPGIAVARAWLRGGPERRVLFVGTASGIEARVLPREELPLETISAAGIVGRSPGQQIGAAFLMARGLAQSLGIIGRFRPHVVLGVGGYASAPAVAAAWLRRRPIVLLEENVVPGMTNRLLGRLARRVALAFPGAAPYFPLGKAVETGLPLRGEFGGEPARPVSFWEGPLRVLIFGGSQGARALNEAVIEALPLLGERARAMRFVHQTGEADLERTREAYAGAGAEAEVAAFFYDMADRFRNAHLAVARAGASTAAELASMGLPAVLIPLPSATHGHQEANARHLAGRGAARMVLQRDLSGASLAALLKEFDEGRHLLAEMSRRAREAARPDASEAVAVLCKEAARAA